MHGISGVAAAAAEWVTSGGARSPGWARGKGADWVRPYCMLVRVKCAECRAQCAVMEAVSSCYASCAAGRVHLMQQQTLQMSNRMQQQTLQMLKSLHRLLL